MVSGKFSLAKLVVLMEKTLDIFDQKLNIFGQNGVNQCFFLGKMRLIAVARRSRRGVG